MKRRQRAGEGAQLIRAAEGDGVREQQQLRSCNMMAGTAEEEEEQSTPVCLWTRPCVQGDDDAERQTL